MDLDRPPGWSRSTTTRPAAEISSAARRSSLTGSPPMPMLPSASSAVSQRPSPGSSREDVAPQRAPPRGARSGRRLRHDVDPQRGDAARHSACGQPPRSAADVDGGSAAAAEQELVGSVGVGAPPSDRGRARRRRRARRARQGSPRSAAAKASAGEIRLDRLTDRCQRGSSSPRRQAHDDLGQVRAGHVSAATHRVVEGVDVATARGPVPRDAVALVSAANVRRPVSGARHGYVGDPADRVAVLGWRCPTSRRRRPGPTAASTYPSPETIAVSALRSAARDRRASPCRSGP